MAEQIMDGRGSGNAWGVDEDNAAYVKVLDNSGSVAGRPIDRYMPAETDVSNTGSMYHGFEADDGSWYIQQTLASGGSVLVQSFRYVAGNTNLTGSWPSRTSLSYGNAGSVF